jgi:nucleoside-diphosphate-sugar epimerase
MNHFIGNTAPLLLNPSQKILVTGGAGFLGSHICEQLLIDGKQVVVVDALNNDTSSSLEKKRHIDFLGRLSRTNESAQFRFYEIDILQENHLTKVLKDEEPTICIHAASLVMDRRSVEEPIRYIINNVQGTQCLLNAIRHTESVRKLVLISSRAAVGETDTAEIRISEDDLLRPINPYGATKVAKEAICHAFYKNFGLSVAICRMQPLYGPRSRRDMMPRILMEAVLHNKVVKKFGNGQAIRDWLYVKDAVIGILAALNHNEKFSVFNFGTGIGTTLNDLIQMVMEVTGKELNIQNEKVPPGDAIYTGLCDYEKAKKALDWEPKVDLRTGLKIMYEYMRRQPVGGFNQHIPIKQQDRPRVDTEKVDRLITY